MRKPWRTSFFIKDLINRQIYEERRPRSYFRKTEHLKLKRSGINIVELSPDKQPGRENQYFNNLEEAIVSRMTDLFAREKLRTDPKYKTSFETMDKIKNWLQYAPQMFPGEKNMTEKILSIIPYLQAIDRAERVLEVLYGDENNYYKLGFVHSALARAEKEERLLSSDRITEQKAMDRLFDSLVEKEIYTSREEAFASFARASFSGKLLPLARQIDGKLGAGSFREIAERFKTAPKPSYSYIKRLISRLKPRQKISSRT